MTDDERTVVQQFHDLYYNGPAGYGNIYNHTTWMGVPCLQCPLDLWIYQEILMDVRPDLVIETGTHRGGSALFLAHMLDLLGGGTVFTIDPVTLEGRPQHPRIHYVLGSSTDAGLIQALLRARPAERRLVILDADHTQAHVAAELALLVPYVSVGSYVIVEDTNINGHPTYPTFGPGPWEAVEDFLCTHPAFVPDSTREKFLMTFNPRGYLRRMA
jgi:cephalosporin hydroxylase